jgi:hypothetical protein
LCKQLLVEVLLEVLLEVEPPEVPVSEQVQVQLAQTQVEIPL